VRLRFEPGTRVFVFSQAIDMRWGFSKLQALVTEKMKANLFEGNLFLFLGKNPRRAKLLLFDGSGLILMVKRLDQGSFISVVDLFGTQEITQEDLKRLLDGANLRVVFASRKRTNEGQEVA
jgi:transposase